MYFTTTTIATLLALAASTTALPAAAPAITLRIANDLTGASASATIAADGTSHDLTSLFCGSAIDSGSGDLFGTSAQLTQFQDLTKCHLVNVNVANWKFDIDGRAKNFVDLDGDVTKAVPVWLNGFTFSCDKPY